MVKRVCAWCDKLMGYASFTAHDPKYNITHGICQECKEQIMSTRKKPLQNFLDQFEKPIYLIHKDMAIKTTNITGVEYINKPLEKINNATMGVVLDCIFADSSGGCGSQETCKKCTLRNYIQDTFTTGTSFNNIQAEMQLKTDNGQEKATLSISTERVGDIVFLQINNPVIAPA